VPAVELAGGAVAGEHVPEPPDLPGRRRHAGTGAAGHGARRRLVGAHPANRARRIAAHLQPVRARVGDRGGEADALRLALRRLPGVVGVVGAALIAPAQVVVADHGVVVEPEALGRARRRRDQARQLTGGAGAACTGRRGEYGEREDCGAGAT
jgi:hypothetical protein